VTIDLGRRLLSSGAVSADDVHAALFAHLTQGTHFLHALILRGAVDEPAIDREVARAELPSVPKVIPNLDLVARLPRGLCATLLAVPVRVDPFSSRVDVAAADPFDSLVAAEFAFHLRATVRVLYARVSLVDEAIDAIERALGEDERRTRHYAPDSSIQRSTTPAFGSVAAAIALQAAQRSSDMPIPLVRRSQAPRPAASASPRYSPSAPIDPNDPPDDDVRITRDAILLDPGAIGAAASQHTLERDDSSLGTIPPLPSPPRFSAVVEAPRLLDAVGLEEALVALEHAGNREAVVQALLTGMRSTARRVAVFAVRRDSFSGWACSDSVTTSARFRDVEIPRDPPSALTEAASRGWFLGELSTSPGDRLLSGLLHPPADEIAIVAVRISGRPVVLIVADQLSDTMIATRTADRLARSAAAALLRVLRTDKSQTR